MLAGTQQFSQWLGPAAQEASVDPRVARALQAAQDGSGKVLDFTCDVIGSLGR